MPHVAHPTRPPAETPVSLFELNGPHRVFPTRRALAKWLGHGALIHGALGTTLAPGCFSLCDEWIPATRWVARQDEVLIRNEDLLALLPPRRPHYGRPLPDPSSYRCAPVPGTGVRHSYRWFRHPRTQALLRDARFAAEDQTEPRMRARLGRRPTAWDDQSRQDARDRSWKRHRSTQWK